MAKKKKIKLLEPTYYPQKKEVKKVKAHVRTSADIRHGRNTKEDFEKRQKKKETTQTTPTTQPVIKAEKKKTGLGALVEKDTLAGKAAKVITSPTTTAVLGSVLATLLTRKPTSPGAVSSALTKARSSLGITGRITHTVSRTGKNKLTQTAQRALVGKPAIKDSTRVAQIFKQNPFAAKFATNKKSVGLSQSFVKKAITTAAHPATIVSIIGTYPFAGFIKEEALQTLSFGTKSAMDAGDYETAAVAIAEQQEIIDSVNEISDKIPFVNVIKQLRNFYEAAQTKIDIDKKVIERKIGIREGEIESEFAKNRRVADEQAAERGEEQDALNRQTKLEERARDAEYFRLIREGKFEEAQELLDQELKGGND